MAKQRTKIDVNFEAVDKLVSKEGLPHNLDAEKSVLGAVVLNNELLPSVLEKLDLEDFISPANKKIFNAMKELYLTGTVIDIITLREKIESLKGGIGGIGGIEYLSNLLEGMPILSNIDHYINLLKEKTILRKLIIKSYEIISSVYSKEDENSGDPSAILNSAEKTILEVGQETMKSTPQRLSSFSTDVMTTINSLVRRGEHVTGVPTGFPKLDELTSGFQKKDLILLAARPSVGKTAFALTLALNAAKKGKYGVIFFSLEMSKEQLFFRMLSQETFVELSRIRSGYLSKEHTAKITRKLDDLSHFPIYVDDNPSVTILEIGAKTRRLKTQTNIDLVIIDYLQLMTPKGLEGDDRRRFENRNQEVAAISRALKILAKDLDLPIVALSQLSRAPEKRGDSTEPVLSDLRDSGSLEQDADLVLFLHRPYMSERKKKEWTIDEKAKATLIIAKQRNGPTDEIPLVFNESFTKFTPFAPSTE
jgi:replicative DNA helicase